MGRLFLSVIALVVAAAVSCREVVIVPSGDTDTVETDLPGTDSDTLDTAFDDTETASSYSCSPTERADLVCMNFEDGLGASVNQLNGTLEIDTAQVYSGNGSMKAQTAQINSIAAVTESFSSIETGTVYFRMYVFVPSGVVTGNTKVLNLSALGEPTTDVERGVDINIGADRSVNIYQHANTARFASAAAMIPEGEWFCLRGSYAISSTNGATIVWVNDNLAVSTIASPDAIINGGVSELQVGIGWTETGQDTATFYFDDVVLATEPSSCAL